MGFTVMESFMDEVSILKNGASGIVVEMRKYLENKKRAIIGGKND